MLFRINSAYCESKSFGIPAMPRPPNGDCIDNKLLAAFFFGLFGFGCVFSVCIVTIGFKLGIDLLGIPLVVGMMLNDFGKSWGKLGFNDKSVHIFFGCTDVIVVFDFRLMSAGLRCFG